MLRVPGRPFRTFVFLKPDGMDELTFHFEGDIQDVTVGKADFERFMVRDAAEIVCVTRALAGRMTVLDAEASPSSTTTTRCCTEDGDGWTLESPRAENGIDRHIPEGLLGYSAAGGARIGVCASEKTARRSVRNRFAGWHGTAFPPPINGRSPMSC